MTNCIICHKELVMITNVFDTNTVKQKSYDIIAESKQFVCICFDCIKKQNKN